MEKSTKIMIGVGIVAAALAGFMWWKNKQTAETNSDGSGDTLPEKLPETIPDGEPAKNGVVMPPAKDDKIMKFQDWMDKNHPNWVKATNATLSNGKSLNKRAGYGNNGSSTTKAMALYGKEYNSKANTSTTVAGAPAVGATLYTANKDVVLYSDASTKKALRVIRNTPNRIGLFKRPSSVKGWWLITAPNEQKMKNEDVYVQSSSVTTVPR